jgi:hypothetical protein
MTQTRMALFRMSLSILLLYRFLRKTTHSILTLRILIHTSGMRTLNGTEQNDTQKNHEQQNDTPE